MRRGLCGRCGTRRRRSVAVGVSFDGDGGGRGYLVRSRVVGEADVAVDAEVDVFEGELGDGGVQVDDGVGEGGGVGFPVFEGAAEFAVVGWGEG